VDSPSPSQGPRWGRSSEAGRRPTPDAILLTVVKQCQQRALPLPAEGPLAIHRDATRGRTFPGSVTADAVNAASGGRSRRSQRLSLLPSREGICVCGVDSSEATRRASTGDTAYNEGRVEAAIAAPVGLRGIAAVRWLEVKDRADPVQIDLRQP
jgi:hypothetical protein